MYNVILSSQSDYYEKEKATKSILKNGSFNKDKPKEQKEKIVEEEKPEKKISFSGLILPLNTDIEKRWKDPIEN